MENDWRATNGIVPRRDVVIIQGGMTTACERPKRWKPALPSQTHERHYRAQARMYNE